MDYITTRVGPDSMDCKFCYYAPTYEYEMRPGAGRFYCRQFEDVCDLMLFHEKAWLLVFDPDQIPLSQWRDCDKTVSGTQRQI